MSNDPKIPQTVEVSTDPVGHTGTNVDVQERPATTGGAAAAISTLVIAVALLGIAALLALQAMAALMETSVGLGILLGIVAVLALIASPILFSMVKVVSPGLALGSRSPAEYIEEVRAFPVATVVCGDFHPDRPERITTWVGTEQPLMVAGCQPYRI